MNRVKSLQDKKLTQEENENATVWCQNSPAAYGHPNLVYSLCRIVKKNSSNYVLSECSNKDNTMTFVADAKDVYAANNNQFPKKQENLFQLDFLNNPVIIHHLYERYQHDLFFSKIGPVLLFLNPHKTIQDFNNEKLIKKYKTKKNKATDSLPLHIFHTVHTAIYNLTALQKSQSIIITGISGSGKTELLKQVIHFLAYTNKHMSIKTDEANTNLENVADVLEASDCILQAFGNAKTIDNENASLFIKVYTMCVNDQHALSHFSIKKYLFNSEQMMRRRPNERLYHVFYYILLGANKSFKRKFLFKNVEDYKLLKKEHIPADKFYEKKFDELQEALRVVCKEEKEIEFIYSVLSALLLLGNIEGIKMKNTTVTNAAYICEVPKIYCSKKDKIKTLDEHIFQSEYDENVKMILAASHLLEFNPEALVQYLTTGEIEKTKINNSKVNLLSDIMKRINNFIAILYDEVFEWIINKINSHYDMNKIKKNTPYLCLLDVPYYEDTNNNSLDTLIRNTALEGIRKCYTDFFFKKRFTVYKGEGIMTPSEEVKYKDNENLVKVLIGKGESLFSFLDNASINNNVNKNNLCASIIKRFYKTQMIKECATERGKNFVIKHSCASISYQTEHFLENNNNVIQKDFIRLIKNSECPFVQQLCPAFRVEVNGKIFETLNKHPSQATSLHSLQSEYDVKRLTLSHIAPTRITELMKLLENTFIHLVFCINSNKERQEQRIDKLYVLNQVSLFDFAELELLKEHYYPYNVNFNKFLERYACLKESFNEKKQRGDKTSPMRRLSIPNAEGKEEIKSLMKSLKIDSNNWCVGRNMIFLNEEGVKEVFYSFVPVVPKMKKEFSLKSKASELLENMQNLALRRKKKNSGSTNYCDDEPSNRRSGQGVNSSKGVPNGKLRTKSQTTIDQDERNDNHSSLGTTNDEENFKKFKESLKSLKLEPVEKYMTMVTSKKMMHACDITHIINDASGSSEKIAQVNGSLQCIKAINEQLMQDNIFNQAHLSHFYTRETLFDQTREAKNKKGKHTRKTSKKNMEKIEEKSKHSHKEKHYKEKKQKSKPKNNVESEKPKNSKEKKSNKTQPIEPICLNEDPLTLVKKIVIGDCINLCLEDSKKKHHSTIPQPNDDKSELVLPENMKRVPVAKYDTFIFEEKEAQKKKKRHKLAKKKKMTTVPVIKLDTFPEQTTNRELVT